MEPQEKQSVLKEIVLSSYIANLAKKRDSGLSRHQHIVLDFFRRAADLYVDGLRNMTWGKPLRTMFYVSLALPFVIAYMAYAWASIEKKAITSSELSSSEDKY